MSKKSNPTLIGAFVVGAVALLAAGVALFGGAELFAKRNFYVAYFTENAKGLREGSNVMLNGVRIGFVSGMALIVDETSFESKTEVLMEIMPESYVIQRGGVTIGKGMKSAITHEQLVNEGGLRALLQAESMVTGQLLVELQFRPDTKPVMRGGADTRYPEIPTIPSKIQELLAMVRSWMVDLNKGIDIKEIGRRIENVLKGMDELVNSQDLRESLAGVNSIINKEDTQQLTTTLQGTLKQLRSAAGDAGKLFRNADSTLDTLRADLKPVIEKMVGALDEVRETLAAAKLQLDGESVQTYRLGETLREIDGAARALREFLEYLDQHPEAVLRGKKQ